MNTKRPFFTLFFTNLWGTLNDNYMKTLASFIAIGWVATEYQSMMVSLAAAALVLPYVLCSPLAGRLTQVYSKLRIVRVMKALELPIVAIVILGFVLHNFWVVLTGLFLMGLQSSLYSPAKYGLIRDLGGMENVSRGMGGMEAIAFVGMLSGTVLASLVVDNLGSRYQYALLVVFSLLGLLGSLCLRAQEERTDKRDSVNPIRFLREQYSQARRYPGLNPIIFTLSVFWWMASTIQIGMLIFCKQDMLTDSTTTGLMLATAAVGISAGCVVAGVVDKRRDLMGMVVWLCWAVALLLVVLFLVKLPVVWFGALLFAVAFLAGMFKVPLDAEIQRMVRGPQLNVTLAYFNQVSFLFILLASGTFALLTALLPVRYMFLMLAVVMALTPVYIFFGYRRLACTTCARMFHLRYDVRLSGTELLDTDGGHLILPNHQAVMDPLIVFAELDKYLIQPLVDEAYFNTAATRRLLGFFGAISVPELNSRASRADVEHVQSFNSTIHEALADGRNVLFYPSGHITLDGLEHIGNRQLAWQVCRQLPAGARVIGMRIDGLWGSSWSRYGLDHTPVLATTLLKSIARLLTGYTLRHKRRVVSIELVDITAEASAWATGLTRRKFNARLEEWYNREKTDSDTNNPY